MLLGLYVPISIRVLRVGGELDLLRTWGTDMTEERHQEHKHPFSFTNPAKYNFGVVCCKMVLVFFTVVLTSWLWTVSLGMWCVGMVLLALTVRLQPFGVGRSNRVRAMLDGGVSDTHQE